MRKFNFRDLVIKQQTQFLININARSIALGNCKYVIYLSRLKRNNFKYLNWNKFLLKVQKSVVSKILENYRFDDILETSNLNFN